MNSGHFSSDHPRTFLTMGTALPQGQGIDESAVYADYFYMEALMRYLEPDFMRYW